MLDRIVNDYDKLRKKKYIFHLENGEILNLRFKKVNLPHLIGIGKLKDDDEWIDKFNRKQVTAKEIMTRLKENGRTYEILKSYPSWTGHLTRRMENFTFENINLLLRRSTVCEFIYDPNETENDKAKFVFIDELQNHYIHLFIGRDEKQGYYFPNSFTCEFDKHRQCGNNNNKIRITKIIIDKNGEIEEIKHDHLKATLRSVNAQMKEINRLFSNISNQIRNEEDFKVITSNKIELARKVEDIRKDLDLINGYIPIQDVIRLKHNKKLASFYKKLEDGMFDV